MKQIIVTMILLFLIGCSSKRDPLPDLIFVYNAKQFTQGDKPSFNGMHAIETSLVNFGGSILSFFDAHANGSFYTVNMGINGNQFINPTLLGMNRRFSYVLNYNNVLYCFYEQNTDIYLAKSLDSITWIVINNGNPVLTHSTDLSNTYFYLWNVGVDVDDFGVWHLLVECSDSTNNVGLCYSNANMISDTIDFNPNKSVAQVIPYGGNPFVKNIPGEGLLIIHGQSNDPYLIFGNEWYITASTMDFSTGIFVTHKNKFLIGVPSYHICDPHVVDLPNGGSMMSMSVDQNYAYTAFSKQTLKELYDSLN